jgi:hypothetical protein
MADLLEESIERMPAVKELPKVDPGGVQAKTMTRIGVKQNGPVVKLLAEHDERVGYGFVIVFHGSASPFPVVITPNRPRPEEGAQKAPCNLRTRETRVRITKGEPYRLSYWGPTVVLRT